MDNIYVHVESLPMCVKAVTVEDEEGDYIVFVNANYKISTRWKAVRHEIEHIRKNHLDTELTYVSDCEMVARLAEHERRCVE